MNEFKIIEVKEITAKNGNKFLAYKTIGKGGRKMDVRFTRGCAKIPTEPCLIEVLEGNANVDTTRQYPILWVKEVEEIKPFTHNDNVADYFD